MKSQPPQSRTAAAGAGPAEGGSTPIRVVVADDQLLDRKALLGLLDSQPDFELVGEAGTGEEAVDLCREVRADVLVLSVRLPGLGDISAIGKMRKVAPGTRVLAVSDRGELRCLALNPPRVIKRDGGDDPRCPQVTDCLELAVAQGAVGAIRRTASPEDLFRAIRAVASGNVWYDLGTASRMLQRSLGLSPGQEAHALSDRELQVANLIADGHSNKDISQTLGISEPTVKKHVGRLLEKLGLDDRLQIGLYVARNPLVLERPPGGRR
ncbi:MAG TPA: response regulator transcription factor [Candidatus Saccharimonadales bacterium]|nr:response regulator transcription factor [Candidatus Saccharimonadales bacterium]